MNEEKILTPEEWYVKKYEQCHGYYEWANFDVEEYAEYYYEMKMKKLQANNLDYLKKITTPQGWK